MLHFLAAILSAAATKDATINCVNNVCVYDVRYGGGSSTQGVASLETFDFFVDQQMKAFPNVLFGCSDASSDISFENSEVSGIFGLSLGPDSILNQLSHFIRYRFSYCFSPFSGGIPPPLVVRFGEDIPPLHNAQTTMFVQPPFGVYFFYMELVDISVGNYRINFPPYTFEMRGDGSGGCFIDSGAVITQIDANTPGINAYEQVLNVFDSYYESEGLQTTQGEGFDLCYLLPPEGYYNFAPLTFHFNGADYTVDRKFMHIFYDSYFCVALLGKGSSSTVLGAWQQQNKRIVYDGQIVGLRFADEDCIHDVF
ncbi:putative Monovalent cation:proton antiporter [Hibiscus syriacus]|uniref:Monovalent cation:proton antiporter n=1 Tax=Hibiscus syriacus TaxID=106335 RepID=A0A6A2YKP3_HIBSY|nr:aspartic proteinase nepenthesin-2-like [Hibiscus syriacus]KAE8679127.1 putative Monovalent cation:proton antiporter [Hibiscus syriacus]